MKEGGCIQNLLKKYSKRTLWPFQLEGRNKIVSCLFRVIRNIEEMGFFF